MENLQILYLTLGTCVSEETLEKAQKKANELHLTVHREPTAIKAIFNNGKERKKWEEYMATLGAKNSYITVLRVKAISSPKELVIQALKIQGLIEKYGGTTTNQMRIKEMLHFFVTFRDSESRQTWEKEILSMNA